MTDDGKNRHVVDDFDSLATELACHLFAADDDEIAMRELWRYQETLRRALIKSGVRDARAAEICNQLQGRVVEALNRMRHPAHAH
jgi:hypothetical protein